MAQSEFFESTIITVRADFGFSEFNCDPDEITMGLGIEPDDVRIKDEFRILPSNGRKIRNPFSSWSISSHSESKDINEHLRQLLIRLDSVCPPFDPNWGNHSFGILWKGNYLYAGSGPYYEADVLSGVSRLDTFLYQDIYQIDQD